MQELEYIRKDAHRRYVRAGAGALHDERRAAVPIRGERDDVVAPLRRGERVIPRELPDFGARAAALERPDVSQDRAARLRALQALSHLGVMRRVGREELRRERTIGQT